MIFFLFLLKNEYPQSMFWSKKKKKKKIGIPKFNYIKVGFTGVFNARTCFPDEYTRVSKITDNNIQCCSQ